MRSAVLALMLALGCRSTPQAAVDSGEWMPRIVGRYREGAYDPSRPLIGAPVRLTAHVSDQDAGCRGVGETVRTDSSGQFRMPQLQTASSHTPAPRIVYTLCLGFPPDEAANLLVPVLRLRPTTRAGAADSLVLECLGHGPSGSPACTVTAGRRELVQS